MIKEPNIKFIHLFQEFDFNNNIIRDLILETLEENLEKIEFKNNKSMVVGNTNIGWSTRRENDLKKIIAQKIFDFRIKSASHLIWYGNELIPKPHVKYDLYLYYNEIVPHKTLYFPGVYLVKDFFSNKKYAHDTDRVGISNLVSMNYSQKREVSQNNKKLFCCAFINNLTPEREKVLSDLSRLGKVDVYGSAGRGKVQYKYPIAKDYKFFLCMENEYVDGFITEKALEAWACQAIPIWWGRDTHKILNKKAYINIDDIKNGNYLNQIYYLNRNDAMYEYMLQQNIINLDTGDLYKELKRKASKILFQK